MLLFGSDDALHRAREGRPRGSADVVEGPNAPAGPESCAGYLAYPFKNQEVNKFYRKPLRHLLMHKL